MSRLIDLTAPFYDGMPGFSMTGPDGRQIHCTARIREVLHEDGLFFMVEPDVEPELEQNVNPGGALLYAMSTLHCSSTSLG